SVSVKIGAYFDHAASQFSKICFRTLGSGSSYILFIACPTDKSVFFPSLSVNGMVIMETTVSYKLLHADKPSLFKSAINLSSSSDKRRFPSSRISFKTKDVSL